MCRPMLHQICSSRCNDAVASELHAEHSSGHVELNILGKSYGRLLASPEHCMASCRVCAGFSNIQLSLTLTLLHTLQHHT